LERHHSIWSKREISPEILTLLRLRKESGQLPVYLDKIHNVFHVSLLQKAKIYPSRVLPQVPMKIKGDLTMEAKPVKILDRDEKVLKNKRVPLVRVLWRSSRIEEEIWEREFEMKEKFPHLFLDIGK